MSVLRATTVLLSVAFTFATLTSASSEPKYAHTGPTIITNVTIIDGLGNALITGQDIAPPSLPATLLLATDAEDGYPPTHRHGSHRPLGEAQRRERVGSRKKARG